MRSFDDSSKKNKYDLQLSLFFFSLQIGFVKLYGNLLTIILLQAVPFHKVSNLITPFLPAIPTFKIPVLA